MKFLKPLLFSILSTSMIASPFVSAEQIDVEYKRFYSHINKIGDEDTAALQFAFGFLRVGSQSLCNINSVTIVTPKKNIPLEVTQEQRFLVPKEKALKLADAQVAIDLAEAANLCDMSVQLETKSEYLKAQYSADEIQYIYKQYEAFFDDMGGFLSFLMPSVSGLVIRFDDESLNTTVDGGLRIENGQLSLSSEWIEKGNTLQLPVVPKRITASAND